MADKLAHNLTTLNVKQNRLTVSACLSRSCQKLATSLIELQRVDFAEILTQPGDSHSLVGQNLNGSKPSNRQQTFIG